MKVGIVLPWRDTPERIEGFEAALRWHTEIFPDFTFYKSDSVGEKFNPSEARNRGCLEAIADGCDVLVVLDADTLFHRLGIIEAIQAAIRTGFVCYPYTYVVDLSLDETVQYLSGRINLELFTERNGGPGTGLANHVGSGWVMTSETFKRLNGWDENFKGWGYEDNAFQEAHLKMLGAPMVRAFGRCYRLNHEGRDLGSIDANRIRFSLYSASTEDSIEELVSTNLVHQKEVQNED